MNPKQFTKFMLPFGEVISIASLKMIYIYNIGNKTTEALIICLYFLD
jgi:hypothetical protein